MHILSPSAIFFFRGKKHQHVYTCHMLSHEVEKRITDYRSNAFILEMQLLSADTKKRQAKNEKTKLEEHLKHLSLKCSLLRKLNRLLDEQDFLDMALDVGGELIDVLRHRLQLMTINRHSVQMDRRHTCDSLMKELCHIRNELRSSMYSAPHIEPMKQQLKLVKKAVCSQDVYLRLCMWMVSESTHHAALQSAIFQTKQQNIDQNNNYVRKEQEALSAGRIRRLKHEIDQYRLSLNGNTELTVFLRGVLREHKGANDAGEKKETDMHQRYVFHLRNRVQHQYEKKKLLQKQLLNELAASFLMQKTLFGREVMVHLHEKEFC